MFTGIIEELGEVARISRKGRMTLLEIKANEINKDIKTGDSVAINGACLTLVERKESILKFDVMPETFEITNLGQLKIKDKVNLERALKVGDRISGHFVTGHVDCLGVIRRRDHVNGNLSFLIAVPVKFIKHIVPKGSVSVDGISLTVVDKKSDSFTVYIIPHTLKNTTLSLKMPSDKVNLEFDILTKSVQRF